LHRAGEDGRLSVPPGGALRDRRGGGQGLLPPDPIQSFIPRPEAATKVDVPGHISDDDGRGPAGANDDVAVNLVLIHGAIDYLRV
jgi:hypothetical protein